MDYKKLGLTSDLTVISISSAIYNMGFTVGTALLILYLINLGYSPFLAGALITVSRLFYSVAMMITGSLSDRIGRKLPIILGFALTGLALLAISAVTNESAVAVLVVLVWLGFSFISPAISAAVSESALLNKIPIAFAWYYTLFHVAQFLGQTLAGVAVQNYGFPSTLLLGGGLAIVAITLMFRFDEKRQDKDFSFGFYQDLKRAIRLIRSERKLQYLSIALSVHQLGFFMFYSFIPLLAEVDLFMDTTTIGLILAVFTAGSILTLLPFGIVTNKIGGLNMLIWHLALSSLTWWILPFLRSYEGTMLLMITLGIIGAMDMPARRDLMIYISEKELATAIGASDSISMTIASLGALMAGALWEVGHWVPFVASVFVNAVGIPFLFKLRHFSATS